MKHTSITKNSHSIPTDHEIIKQELISVLQNESKSIDTVARNLPDTAITLVKMMLNTTGRIVFSGMGKSGFVARKLVATCSSTGKASLFLHPSEALHGDLGMVQQDDLFIAISKSGTGTELEQIVPILKATGNKTCLICCNKGVLNSVVDLSVCLPFEKEACALNLVPTSSSTITMAFGDALAITVSKLLGFGKNDFARNHPSGALGKRLLLTVNSLMNNDETLPLISPETSFKETILLITKKKLGIGIIVDQNKTLLGIITDGDLRRAYEFGPKLFEKTAVDIMTMNPKTISENILAFDALKIMEDFNITSLVVTKQNIVVGLLHIHDLIKSGIR